MLQQFKHCIRALEREMKVWPGPGGYVLLQLVFKYTESIDQGFLDVEIGTAVIMVVRGRYLSLASEEVFAGDWPLSQYS